ncbi:MAG: RNA polymerase subunit sigma-24 [Lentimicrobiaceae bacterium]|jgi:RNA polymerase sigma factor (sigma-70 family)|nr:RNA polymerase subunit sigma-24 [Lentimicrobiaceae bacterium]MDG1901200.1 sigma-70 family RNA polymerase sigma factor [Bacteroidales bacterium]MDG2080332.1 sigma-70 family RNA polymerase sigma factor [Bacteroidales bacterium]|tara:strand:+ start:5544 stop:6131 length:588 start_codon:yes stop_codon:yes gene_type:complete
MSKVTRSEKELVKSFINGDHSSLQILIERHQNRLYSYIFLLVKDKQLADDIFQDTYVKVINTLRKGTYNDEGKFIQWVMRIAHNLVIDHFRKSKKVPTVDNSYNDFDVFDTIKFTDPSVEEQLVVDQIHTDVRKLLEFLPEEQREVLYLRCYSGLSFKDIAEQTDVSINTALGRMRYAIINMRKIIEENKVILTS